MPKKILNGQTRLMPWEYHILDAIVRVPLSSRDLHGFLLEIYQCSDDKITLKDVQRCIEYLRALKYIYFQKGFYFPTDAGVTFTLWVADIESLKFQYFNQFLIKSA